MLNRLQERLERMTVDRRVKLFRWITGLAAGGAVAALLLALLASPTYRPHGQGGEAVTPEQAALRTQVEQLRQERDLAHQQVDQLKQKNEEEAAINEALRADLQQATARLRQKPAK